MNAGDEETLKAYIDESLEHLAGIETDLLEIEKAGADLDVEKINEVFRAAHSIKGGAGFVGLINIKALSHQMENVLGLMRNGKLIPDAENINFLLLASDTLKNLLTHVETSDQADISDSVNALASLMDASTCPPKPILSEAPEPRPGESFPATPSISTELAIDPALLTEIRAEGKSVYQIEIPMEGDPGKKSPTPEEILTEAGAYGIVLAHRVDESPDFKSLTLFFACVLDSEDTAVLFEIDPANVVEVDINEAGPAPSRAQPPALESPSPPISRLEETEKKLPETSLSEELHKTVSETSLRVQVSLLDTLMTLAGELVLGRNQLLQSLSNSDLHTSEMVGKRIDHITSELQEAIMRTRMQPIGNIFNKFPRLARDLARGVGKEVELFLEGKDVELDKTLIEAIGDPLTHLVRNAIDHGIEHPHEREAAGKHPIGRIELKAFHEAGQVNIEISDDGRGLDTDNLSAAALLKGFISDEQARGLSDKEKINLIFLPGFSMARTVTDLSGRGVGMDVVKTNLDRLGGQISLDTTPGMGTTMRIKVPLTLAIIPSQIIVTGGERYAIPQVNLLELIRIPANQVKKRIELIGDAEVVRLRSSLLPMVRLADLLRIRRTYRDPRTSREKIDRRERIADRRSRKTPLFGSLSDHKPQTENDSFETHPPRSSDDRRYRVASGLNVAVVSSGAMKYGLVVDALLDSEEIVVHPLGRHLKQTKGYAGATIMGDGRVALILDVMELAQLAQLSSIHQSKRAQELKNQLEQARKAVKAKQSLLVFGNPEDEQFAVPLNQVLRIEKISAADIEEVGGRKVMQYRGGNLLLFAIDQVARVKPLAENRPLLVLVFMLAGREIGLMVTGPIDGVEITEKLDESALKQPGIMGSIVIDGRTTMMVDILDIIQTLNPQWLADKKDTDKSGKAAPRILIAEDSNFFREQVKGFMEAEGYSVIAAEDGQKAWDLLEENEETIALVVTDMEMPHMDGFELAEKIKTHSRYSRLPVIALTTLAEDEDIARGKKAGIDDYQIKMDREKLMESINRFMDGK